MTPPGLPLDPDGDALRSLDTPRLLAGQERALRRLPVEVVRAHHEALRRESAALYGDESLGLTALVLQLQADLSDLLTPADSSAIDPLAYYEEHVAPVLARLHAAVGAREPLVHEVDLGADLVCYNLYPFEAANGFRHWRWMGPAPRSGLLVPLGPGTRLIEVVAQPSHPAQLAELTLWLNGRPLDDMAVRDEGSFSRIEAPLSEAFLAAQDLESYPYGFLDLDAPTRRPPAPGDSRSLGLGIGAVRVLRA